MKVSVVTVCYNSAATIGDAILSVASQSYGDREHIIIDGGSTDGTGAVIQRHADKISRLVMEPDEGIYDAMNKGIALSSGDVIGFLNADDVYANDRVLARAAEVLSDPSVDACYADLVYVDAKDLNRVVRYWRSCPYVDGLFGKGWCPPHPTFLVKKRIYEAFGCFDLTYPIGNDVELMMRFLARHKISSVYIPELFVKMRIGGVSNRSFFNIIRQNIQILKAAKQNNVPVSPLVFIIAKVFSRVYQFKNKPDTFR
jgi:glycosyltransferase involved in cell wall biosynthesis